MFAMLEAGHRTIGYADYSDAQASSSCVASGKDIVAEVETTGFGLFGSEGYLARSGFSDTEQRNCLLAHAELENSLFPADADL
jgi:hypothetical protein